MISHPTGTSGVADRPGHQPPGQLPLHPGQQHCPTGRENVTSLILNLFPIQGSAFFVGHWYLT